MDSFFFFGSFMFEFIQICSKKKAGEMLVGLMRWGWILHSSGFCAWPVKSSEGLAVVSAMSICVIHTHTCLWNSNDHCFDWKASLGRLKLQNTGQMSFRYLLRLIRFHAYNTIFALRIPRHRYICVVVRLVGFVSTHHLQTRHIHIV